MASDRLSEAKGLVNRLSSLLDKNESSSAIIGECSTPVTSSNNAFGGSLDLFRTTSAISGDSNPRRVHARLFGYQPASTGSNRKRSLEVFKGCSKKPNKLSPWSHVFVCLSSTDNDTVPSEYSLLTANGLGKKKVSLYEQSNAGDIHKSLIDSFPKLSGAGGYELLRTIENSKKLSVIVPPPEGYTGTYLKNVLGQAKCFIRPIQHDIELSDSPSLDLGTEISPDVPRTECEHCHEMVPMINLRSHVDSCHKNADLIEDIIPATSHYKGESPNSPLSFLSEETSDIVISSDSDSEKDRKEVDDVMFEQAVSDSLKDISSDNTSNDSPTLVGLLTSLSEYKNQDFLTVTIRRAFVLNDTLRIVKRLSFSCMKTFKVEFLNEVAEDGGGPSREFWCLLGKEISENLFEGLGNTRALRHDSLALQEEKYYYVGQLMAMGLTQGGCRFCFFATSIYSYLCGTDISKIKILDDEVPSYEARALIQQINEANDDNMLRSVVLNEADVIMDAGYSKPLTALTMASKHDLIKTLKIHYTLLKSLAELDQLKKGLAVLGVGEAMAKHSDIMAPLFIAANTEMLTAESVKDLFQKVYFSPKGSSDLVKEEATYMLFLDFLHECESMSCNPDQGGSEDYVDLGIVLSFTTGSEMIPPLGFDHPLAIRFDETNVFPTACTCALELTLPTKYFNQPKEFNQKLSYAMKNHGGFGLL